MLRQYASVKSEHADAILMFRMGDFYEMFYDDAVAAARALDITLTARGKGTGNAVPMCGVPYQAADQYVARLVRQGFRVALCDQVEEASPAKKLVRREVVRVVTPGTVTDPGQLDARTPSYLAAVAPGRDAVGIALADLTTGDLRMTELPAGARPNEIAETLAPYAPREILHDEGRPLEPELTADGVAQPTPRPEWSFAIDGARRALCEHLGVANLSGYGVEAHEAAIAAGGALLGYLQETQKASLRHVDRLQWFERSAHLVMDSATRRNLELVRSLADGGTRGTPLWTVDRTVTPMGGRRLRDWLLQPLAAVDAIRERQERVAALVRAAEARERLREALASVADLERLLSRLAIGTATPRELGALRGSLEAIPEVRQAAAGAESRAVERGLEDLEDLSDLAASLREALADDLPVSSKEGGIVRGGYDPDVDEARSLSQDARSTLARIEARERERTGIGSLKVRYNKVFGYYIEVSRTNLKNVPADYERRQTLVNGERFITPELKEYETKILGAQERLSEREHEIFQKMRSLTLERASGIRRTASAVASLDAIASFAEVAAAEGWVRPEVGDGERLEIRDGRHPVVERLMTDGRFVPNDLTLDSGGERIAIVTGPNMGGKSTFLRQTALMVILAQAGSFVPAASAEIGRVDRVFSRIGASDNLAGGQSTFLVEMSETANILHSATPRSLVLLDEVGRGTSTFDGLSLAWAVVEHLHDVEHAAAKTLFATHYHELTDLARTLPGVANLHIAAREHGGTVVFLHEVRPGPADRSYGIQVARLAGVPPEVVERAREILDTLERNEFNADGVPKLARRPSAAERQMPLFVPAGEAAGPSAARAASEPDRRPDPHAASNPVLEALRRAEPDRMTPLEALTLLSELKKLAGED